ncbi:CIA30 family protein [Luminiphilus syltensis]|nr:CIA30 family protein [Luminiphilus syltensis]
MLQKTYSALFLLLALGFGSPSMGGLMSNDQLLDAFDTDAGWIAVNDNVMGGRSQGGFEIVDSHLVFSGSINTNGGGFSSIRRPLTPGELSNTDGVKLRIKGDGRRYRVTLRTDVRFRGRTVAYQGTIPSTPKDTWVDVTLAYRDFVPSVFGQRVAVPPLQPATAWSLGFIIADGQDGPFKLMVDEIGLMIDGATGSGF